MLNRRGRFVAGGIARVGGDARVDVLIVPQREETDPHRRIADADGAARIERITRIADLDAGVDIVRRRPQHHELRTAEIDEVVDRHHGDPRRIEPDRQVASGVARDRPRP